MASRDFPTTPAGTSGPLFGPAVGLGNDPLGERGHAPPTRKTPGIERLFNQISECMQDEVFVTTINQIKQANQATGHHFFESATLRFFDSRIGNTVYEGGNGRLFFVTSERFSDECPRLYTLREALPDGSIKTVGDFQGYESAAAAQQAIPKSER